MSELKISPEAREAADEIHHRVQDKMYSRTYCETRLQLAINSAVAEKDKEIERLKHFIDCAKTPLMADVMRERDSYLTRIQMVEEYRINDTLTKQLSEALLRATGKWKD